MEHIIGPMDSMVRSPADCARFFSHLKRVQMLFAVSFVEVLTGRMAG